MRGLPNGEEKGRFLALDLGGTNFRVLAMELTPDKEFLMDSKIYAIPQYIMTGNIPSERYAHTNWLTEHIFLIILNYFLIRPKFVPSDK